MSYFVVFNLQECVALEELYLSHNGIAKMEGLSTLANLRVLDVSANKLTEINDIMNLTKYEFFPGNSKCVNYCSTARTSHHLHVHFLFLIAD